jgi:hypothetical protein
VVISFDCTFYIAAVVMDSSLSVASQNVIATAIANVMALPARRITLRAQYLANDVANSLSFSILVQMRIFSANSDFPNTTSFNSTELFEYLSDILLESVASAEMTGAVRALARSSPAPQLPYSRVMYVNISSFTEYTVPLDTNVFVPADENLGIVIIVVFVLIMFVCVMGILAYRQMAKFFGERSAHEEHMMRMAAVTGSLGPDSLSSGFGQGSPGSVRSAFSPGAGGVSPSFSHVNERWAFYHKNQVGGSPQWQRVAQTARPVVSRSPGSTAITTSWGVEETKTDPGLFAVHVAMEDDDEDVMRVNSML